MGTDCFCCTLKNNHIRWLIKIFGFSDSCRSICTMSAFTCSAQQFLFWSWSMQRYCSLCPFPCAHDLLHSPLSYSQFRNLAHIGKYNSHFQLAELFSFPARIDVSVPVCACLFRIIWNSWSAVLQRSKLKLLYEIRTHLNTNIHIFNVSFAQQGYLGTQRLFLGVW